MKQKELEALADKITSDIGKIVHIESGVGERVQIYLLILDSLTEVNRK